MYLQDNEIIRIIQSAIGIIQHKLNDPNRWVAFTVGIDAAVLVKTFSTPRNSR
jgi:hypothetical protein